MLLKSNHYNFKDIERHGFWNLRKRKVRPYIYLRLSRIITNSDIPEDMKNNSENENYLCEYCKSICEKIKEVYKYKWNVTYEKAPFVEQHYRALMDYYIKFQDKEEE